MTERRQRWNRFVDLLAWAAFGYVVFVQSVVIVWDASLGFPLHYAPGGKRRGESRWLEEFAFEFGIIASLLAIWLIIRFARRAFVEPDIKRKGVCVFVVFLCCLLLYLN